MIGTDSYARCAESTFACCSSMLTANIEKKPRPFVLVAPALLLRVFEATRELSAVTNSMKPSKIALWRKKSAKTRITTWRRRNECAVASFRLVYAK